MNRISFLLSLFVACWAAGAGAETRDCLLVAGQSNAVGYDAKRAEMGEDAADKQVMFWWRAGDPPPDEHDSTSGGKWTQLQAQPKGNPKFPKLGRQYGNFSNAEGGFGPEIGFARTLFAREQKPLAVVKAAWSGTGMAQDWNPADPGDGGSCYRGLVSEVRAAVAAAKAQGVTLRLRALAWVQGESDANPTLAPRYEKALGEMISALRKDLDAPELVALVAVNTRFGGGKNAFMPKIVEAQQVLAGKLPRCAYVDTASATIANSAHFDSAGTLDVGKRFAEALLKWESGKTAAAAPAPAAKPARSQVLVNGETFTVAGRPAFIMWPEESKRAKPQPWVMYAPTLAGTPDSHERWMHEQFLAAGVAVAGVDVGEGYGSPASREVLSALHAELTGKRGFASRVALLGRSRGGLWVSSWGAENVEKVSGLAGIYPVFDFRTYPKVERAAPAYGMTAEQLTARAAEFNPIERVVKMARAKIPAVLIHGDEDKVVPLKENSAEFLARYEGAGVGNLVKLIVPKGQGHNYWEGFFRCQELIDFTIARAKAGAAEAK